MTTPMTADDNARGHGRGLQRRPLPWPWTTAMPVATTMDDGRGRRRQRPWPQPRWRRGIRQGEAFVRKHLPGVGPLPGKIRPREGLGAAALAVPSSGGIWPEEGLRPGNIGRRTALVGTKAARRRPRRRGTVLTGTFALRHRPGDGLGASTTAARVAAASAAAGHVAAAHVAAANAAATAADHDRLLGRRLVWPRPLRLQLMWRLLVWPQLMLP